MGEALEKRLHIRSYIRLFPCIFGIVDDVIVIAHRKQHNTGLGYAHVVTHWKLERDVVISLKYDKHAWGLKPLTAFCFSGSRFSMLNYSAEIFTLIQNGNIDVYLNRGVNRLSRHIVVSETRQLIRTDA
jgi:hypothetical protein